MQVREQQKNGTDAQATVIVSPPSKKKLQQRKSRSPSPAVVRLRSPSPPVRVREEVTQTARSIKVATKITSKTQASPGRGMSRFSGSIVHDSAPTSAIQDDELFVLTPEEADEEDDIVLTEDELDMRATEPGHWSPEPEDQEDELNFHQWENNSEEEHSDWEFSLGDEPRRKRSRRDETQSPPPRSQPRPFQSSPRPRRRTVYCLEDIQELPLFPPADKLIGSNVAKGLDHLDKATEEVLDLEKAISILSTRKKDIRTHMEDIRRHLTKLDQEIPPSLPGGMPRAMSVPGAEPISSPGSEGILRSKSFKGPRTKRFWTTDESNVLRKAYNKYGHAANQIKAAYGKRGQPLEHWDADSIRSRIRVMAKKREL
jgi:hypothetical protein